MWRVYKEAGRPWPVISDDDVIDYMVMEAVAMKAAKQAEEDRKEAEKQAEKKQWAETQKERLKELVR